MKMHGSHLRYKFAHKCLNVPEWWKCQGAMKCPLLSPAASCICQHLWKKTRSMKSWSCDHSSYFNNLLTPPNYTLQKNIKFSINDFFSKCGEIRRLWQIWPHLLKNFLMDKLFCCAVIIHLKLRSWSLTGM